MNDSRGNPSRTLPFVVAAFSAATIKFLVGGMTIPSLGTQPVMDVSAYGTAAMMIVGTWVAREWKQKGIENGSA